MSSFLHDRIQERSRLAWNRPHRLVANIGSPTRLLWIARVMRLYGWPLRMAFTNVALPGTFLIVIFGLVLLAAGRSYFGWRDGTAGITWRFGPAAFCQRTDAPKIVGAESVSAPTLFETRNPCWSSGLWVEKDRKYRIWIEMKDPWFDRTVMTGVNGFRTSDHLPCTPFRRWIQAAWFVPVVRIGENADAEHLLHSIDGLEAEKLPRPRDPTTSGSSIGTNENSYPVHVEESESKRSWLAFGRFEAIPQADLQAAEEVWREQGLSSRMVADFTAAASGELFLYVNDAIQLAPFMGPFDLFYQNNRGSAQITIQRLPLPQAGR
jgi:hypothetical protein